SWWGNDSRHAYFLDMDRYYKYVKLVEFDTFTGETRVLFKETSKTHVRLMQAGENLPMLLPLPESNELLWYSDRSGWGHYYLYDLKTGQLKKQVTSGNWLVRELVRFDPKRRELFLQTGGREKGRSPYYRDLVRVNIDTGKLTTLIASDHDYFAHARSDQTVGFETGLTGNALYYRHKFTKTAVSGGKMMLVGANGVSPTGNFAVVTGGRSNTVPESWLVDRQGRKVLMVEKTDISQLPKNWQWPEPVKLLAADGKTDTYGVVFRPTDFDASKHYPVVTYIEGRPSSAAAPAGAFNMNLLGWFYLRPAALAELGFVVVLIDGRGTSMRDKAFLDANYGWIEDASMLADQVAGLKQLAKRYPYMDLERVGITGDTGGLQALLRYPDFYKVGISAMLRDSRLTSSHRYGDMYEGEVGPNPDRKYPEYMVENLKGKLLITQPLLDAIASLPASSFRAIEALNRANKDYDLLVEPRVGYASTAYITRRTWDFLVRHLQGVEPPKGIRLEGSLLYRGTFK
ncbi:MAG: DPP IV N-terminal domain-containing protein, partial [Spongiibacteraceae bacterium]|nr:DPP IV N-terminal domain-containing protein [Spongiibacteraceae bacterium]